MMIDSIDNEESEFKENNSKKEQNNSVILESIGDIAEEFCNVIGSILND